MAQPQPQLQLPRHRQQRLPLLADASGALLAAGDAIVSAPLAAWLATRGARLEWTALA